MLTVQFYTRADCSLCHAALAVVKRVQKRLSFQLETVDIDADPALTAQYATVIPVISCDNIELARSFVDEKDLYRALINRASNRPPHNRRSPA